MDKCFTCYTDVEVGTKFCSDNCKAMYTVLLRRTKARVASSESTSRKIIIINEIDCILEEGVDNVGEGR